MSISIICDFCGYTESFIYNRIASSSQIEFEFGKRGFRKFEHKDACKTCVSLGATTNLDLALYRRMLIKGGSNE